MKERKTIPSHRRYSNQSHYVAKGSIIRVLLAGIRPKKIEQESNAFRLGSLSNPLDGLALVTDDEVQLRPPCPLRRVRTRQLDVQGSFLSAPPSSLSSCQHPPPWRWENPRENLALLCLSGHIHHIQRPLRSPLASRESTLSLTCSHAYP